MRAMLIALNAVYAAMSKPKPPPRMICCFSGSNKQFGVFLQCLKGVKYGGQN